MTVVATKYTNDQLSRAICSLNNKYTREAKKVVKSKLYYLPGFDSLHLKEIFLYSWVLDSWQQNEFGNSDSYYNYITQEELTCIMEKIAEICK